MNDFSRSSRSYSGGKQFWLFPAVLIGIIVGVILRFVVPQLLEDTAIVGQVFVGALLIVMVPLVSSQLSLSLNNPRERIRRGVSHSKILTQVLVATVVVLALSGVLFSVLSPAGQASFPADFISGFNPTNFVDFHKGSAVYVVLGLSILLATILGAMGEKAQFLVTVCNRISRASIRTFRLLLWIAPIGLISFVGTLGMTPEVGSPTTISSPIILVTLSIAGLLLYATVVLGVEWVVGQMRPARKETRSFDRDRRPSNRRTGTGPYPAGRPSGPQGRPSQRPGAEPRREPQRERSPFDMGVSSTPVLDIEARNATPTESPAASAGTGRRQDFRSRPNRDAQAEPRESQRNEQTDAPREGQREGQRSGYRDRGPRPDRREGGRDGFRDRGPRGPRGDRPPRDRGPRDNRYDQRETPRPMDTSETAEPVVQTPRQPDAATIAADLARVREQLNQSSQENRPPAVRPEPRVETRPSEPLAEKAERPTVREETGSQVESASSQEMHYGRSRHRKGERPDADPVHPGVEQPPLPEMIDHYSTDDMAFGRSKRKKTVK